VERDVSRIMEVTMGSLIDWFFTPPTLPALPLPEHFSAGLLSVVEASYRLVYLRGVYDGLVAGVLIVLVLLPRRCERRD
jgi:hypothetical protein